MDKIRILGLDSSSGVTGWALLETDFTARSKILKTGKFTTKSHIGKKLRPMAERLVDFHLSLVALFEDTRPDYVAFEAHHIAKLKAAMTILKFMGVGLRTARAYTHKEVIEISPAEIRSDLRCKGKREEAKEAVRVTVNKMFGLTIEKGQEDISDAVAVAIVATGRVRQLEG